MAACVLMSAAGPARGDAIVLAYSGQTAPDGNGSYSTFTDPVLNYFGRIAFKGYLAGTSLGSLDDTAILRAEAAGATILCHENWATPDGNGRYQTLGTPAMNNASQVAFRGDARDTLLGAYDFAGLYRVTWNDPPEQIVRGNDPAPDGNGRFFVLSDEPLLDDDVTMVFWASFVGTANGLQDDTAIVGHWWGAPRMLAREGQPAPDGNGELSSWGDVAGNDSQSIAFWCGLRKTAAGWDDNIGIYRARPTYPVILTKLARMGDPAPDGNGEFDMIHMGPVIDNVGYGRVGFKGWLRNTSGGVLDDSGVFLATDTGVVRIAREGQSPPGGNGEYSNFGTDVAQNDSRVAFIASMRNTSGGGADDSGIYWGNGFITREIVREGYSAPDGNGVFSGFGDIVMNDPGHVAFPATLVATASGSADNRGLFIGDGYDLVEVARKGDPLLGSTIAEMYLATGPDCRNGFNDLAQVAYRAVLADGRQALVVYTPTIKWKGGSGGWFAKAYWTLSILPDEHYQVAIAPLGDADVAGPSSDVTVKALTIGSTGGGLAVLDLTRGGDLAAAGTFTVTHGGKVRLGAGHTLSAGQLVNQGTLAFEPGRAHVRGEVANGPGGEIVLAPGAEVWLHGQVHNQGLVSVAPDAVVHLLGLSGNGCSGGGSAELAGDVSPGPGTAQMVFDGDVVFGPFCTTHIELHPGDFIPGPHWDQILVGGDLVLDGLLELRPKADYDSWMTPGQRFEIIDVAGTARGQFHGLGEGAVVNAYGRMAVHITYLGGDGNDVELYAVPEPAALCLLALGAAALLRNRGRYPISARCASASGQADRSK